MKNQRLKIIVCLLVSAFLLITVASVVFIKLNAVEKFSLSDYSSELVDFKSDLRVDPIDSAKEAKKAAETIWISKYGESVKKKWPYIVYRDEKSGAWMITGSIPRGRSGGVPNLIVKDDGTVLAVWHDR